MPVVDALARDQVPEPLKSLYDDLATRYGRVPAIAGVMAHRPEALAAFVPLLAAIMRGGSVDPRYKELAYLKTSLVNGCEYCTRAHIAGAQRIGLTDAHVQALIFYEKSPLFTEAEKAVILYADRLTRAAGAGLRDADLGELRRHFSEEQIVELTLVVCLANFTNRFNNGLRIEPDLG
jgi:uncharacterized peroxidase-related enzyme